MSGSRNSRADKPDLARRAIDYLEQHDLALKWDFPQSDPPPDEIRHLLASYFDDGEIELDMAWFLSDFLVARLEEDYLVVADERSQSSQDPHRPVVVCGDDTSAQR